MRGKGKETVFGTTEEQKLTEEDYRAIIEKYKYLMSEPEKDKKEEKNKKPEAQDQDDDFIK